MPVDTRRLLMDAVGMAVVAADGRDVGRVSDVKGGYFAVDELPGDRRYWLSESYVRFISSVLTLTLLTSEIGPHELTEPGLETEAEEMAGHSDAVISDERALRQRERMERELLEQRRQLGR